jgi:hypothetical protein
MMRTIIMNNWRWTRQRHKVMEAVQVRTMIGNRMEEVLNNQLLPHRGPGQSLPDGGGIPAGRKKARGITSKLAGTP